MEPTSALRNLSNIRRVEVSLHVTEVLFNDRVTKSIYH